MWVILHRQPLFELSGSDLSNVEHVQGFADQLRAIVEFAEALNEVPIR